ncbi:uncharacterized protein LOC129728097 isoform X2 [Wyeomyia smithii]|uniref:uncharacterized protein LOC129728097 isoform X2 n=1 Tax=Wyeomyia smithii TaxID=174621 RepID=UPI002467D4AA|nr:uncharacterized protein LOC129728097 isoform X2 [Wyeomyia smithii]
MKAYQRNSTMFLLFIVTYLTAATISTIVQALQQDVLPQQLIVANSDQLPPAIDLEKIPKDTRPELDANPSLQLILRVLDTYRSPFSTQSVVMLPEQRALPSCPLCDASVYSYCDYKVYHDSCCCGSTNGIYNPGGLGSNGIGYGGCGFQEDCSFIYANSCYEHQLIVNCCCNSPDCDCSVATLEGRCWPTC